VHVGAGKRAQQELGIGARGEPYQDAQVELAQVRAHREAAKGVCGDERRGEVSRGGCWELSCAMLQYTVWL
jgi:hypothetical protein